MASPSPAGVLPLRLRELHAKHKTALAPVWDAKRGLTVKVKGGGPFWPDRERCKKCRKALAPPDVVIGLFCSYACAGLPAPPRRPDDAPRECRRESRPHETGQWQFKKRFLSEAEAAGWQQAGKDSYRCSCCFAIHHGSLASAPPPPPAPVRPADPVAAGVEALLLARGVARRTKKAVEEAERDARAVLLAAGVLRR